MSLSAPEFREFRERSPRCAATRRPGNRAVSVSAASFPPSVPRGAPWPRLALPGAAFSGPGRAPGWAQLAHLCSSPPSRALLRLRLPRSGAAPSPRQLPRGRWALRWPPRAVPSQASRCVSSARDWRRLRRPPHRQTHGPLSGMCCPFFPLNNLFISERESVGCGVAGEGLRPTHAGSLLSAEPDPEPMTRAAA